MSPQVNRRAITLVGFLVCVDMLCGVKVFAQATPSYAGDDNKLTGDHLKLRTNGRGFTVKAAKPAAKEGKGGDESKCAPASSKLTVITDAEPVIVRFYEVPAKKTYKQREDKLGIVKL